MSALQERVLDAMAILSQTAVINSGATLTIECEIIETIDAGLGQYKVKYAENILEAYSNLNSVYQKGDIVFVLVPNGDLTKTLTIIGGVAPNASTYITNEPSDSFVHISGNLFTSIDNIELCSYHPMTQDLTLDTSSFNMIFEDYLKDYRNFVFTAKVKTNIPLEQQQGGNYGLILNLPFLEDAGDGTGLVQTYKTVSIDVNTMQGNPYRFNEYALQNIYFEIAESAQYDTSRNPIMTVFVQDFVQNDSDLPADIWITDIGFKVVDVLSEEEKDGYSLTLVASEGNYFLNSKYLSTKTLSPVLKVNGKTKNTKGYECYWFVEDSSIGINNDSYFKLGGLGWKCLNKKTNVHYNEEGKMTYQYVTNSYTLEVSSTDVTSTLRYKCVLTKDDVVTGGSVCLKNLNNDIEIELISATGTPTFMKNTGYVSLIARIYYAGVSDNPSSAISINTAWQRYDRNNNFLDDNFFEYARINDPVEILDKSGNIKIWLETEIKFPSSLVENFNTINCSFYGITTKDGDRVKYNLGTSSIIVNTSDDFTYKLVIQNGDVLYKYDADGDSPLVADYDGPSSSKIKEILPLGYRLYKNDGTELSDIEYQYCQVEWKIPKNSMIRLKTTSTRDDDNYNYITGRGQFDINYTIADTYNVKKIDNSIYLKVTLNDIIITEVANIKFLKDGESGTNGSKYTGIITYQGYGYGELNASGKPHKLHPVLVVNAWRLVNSITGVVDNWSNPQLDVSVYCDGDLMTSEYSVTWRIFDSSETNPLFNISNGIISPKGTSWSNTTSTIVEAEIKVGNTGVTNSQEIIYAYYPIEITYLPSVSYAAGVIPNLIDGFSEVLYAADGTNPKYDNTNPFAYADNLQDADASSYYNYTWTVGGNLDIKKVENNLCTIKPLTKFDNGNSLNYVNVAMQITSSGRSKVNDLINQLNLQANDLNNKISYNQYTLQHILDFSQKFSYNNYIELLNTSKDLLLYRSNLLYYIDQLNIILRDIFAYSQLKNIEINYFNYNEIYNTRITALDAEKNLLYKLGYYNVLSDLHNLNNIKINLNKENIINKYGIAIYDSLNSYITKFNDILDKKYLVSYNSLCAKVNGIYLLQSAFNSFRQLENTLIAYYNDEHIVWLQNSHYGFGPEQEFINLRNQLIAIINKLFDINGYCYSYSAIKQNILDECFGLIIKYQNDYYKTSYNNKIAAIQVELGQVNVDLADFRKVITNQTSGIIRHSKPIIMMFNRYELSNINGWDGNKLYIDSVNNEYLLAPQVGAGAKSNGLFTGVVMGVKQFNRSSLQHIGLFGYSSGIQSYFMNAEDGSVIMGKAGSGQLIADPSQNKALLYSSNYWSNYGTDGKPSSYANSNRSGSGMIIDLTTPEIRFGSGKFYVTSDGNLHAGGNGDGDVGGWYITDSTLQSGNWKSSKNGILLDAGNDMIAFGNSKGKIYSSNHSTLSSTTDGFYLSQDGLSIGKYFTIASTGQATVTHADSNIGQWKLTGEGNNQKLASNQNGILLDAPNSRVILGSSNGEIYSGTHTSITSTTNGFYLSGKSSGGGLSIGSKVYIDNTGVMRLGTGAVANTGKHWTINGNSSNSYILYGTKDTINSVYIGTDGIHLGAKLRLDDTGAMEGGTDSNKKWSITAAGDATFKSLTANKSGNIAGWTISEKELSSKGITISSNGSIKGDGSGGGSWEITRGNAVFNKIEANKEGSIAGWQIKENKLEGGKMEIKSDGSMKGSNWSINSDGDAKFDDITCSKVWTFGKDKTKWTEKGFSFDMGEYGSIANEKFSLKGMDTSWGSGSAFSGGGAASYSSTKSDPFGGECITHIQNLAVGQITADYINAKLAECDKIKALEGEIGKLDAFTITGTTITVNKSLSSDTISGKTIRAQTTLTVGNYNVATQIDDLWDAISNIYTKIS